MQPIDSRQLENALQHASCNLKDAGQEAALVSDRGGKQENQDAFGVFESHDGARIYVIADGLGGHKGGRIASAVAVQSIARLVQQPPTDGQAGFRFHDPASYVAVFHQVNQDLLAAQSHNPELSKMRTTLVILAIRDGLAFWTHVGDVRLYLFRDRQVAFQTRDHSVPQMLADSGEIDHSEIRNHPDRSKLLNALGNPACKPSIPQRYTQLQPGDVFHLSTDGFWEWVTEPDMIKYLTCAHPLDEVSKTLEQQVRQTASEAEPEHDNYSACHVRIRQASRNQAYWHKTAYKAS